LKEKVTGGPKKDVVALFSRYALVILWLCSGYVKQYRKG